jgi:hypothetical protein
VNATFKAYDLMKSLTSSLKPGYNPSGICGGHIGTGIGFAPELFVVLPVTILPMDHIHPYVTDAK